MVFERHFGQTEELGAFYIKVTIGKRDAGADEVRLRGRRFRFANADTNTRRTASRLPPAELWQNWSGEWIRGGNKDSIEKKCGGRAFLIKFQLSFECIYTFFVAHFRIICSNKNRAFWPVLPNIESIMAMGLYGLLLFAYLDSCRNRMMFLRGFLDAKSNRRGE